MQAAKYDAPFPLLPSEKIQNECSPATNLRESRERRSQPTKRQPEFGSPAPPVGAIQQENYGLDEPPAVRLPVHAPTIRADPAWRLSFLPALCSDQGSWDSECGGSLPSRHSCRVRGSSSRSFVQSRAPCARLLGSYLQDRESPKAGLLQLKSSERTADLPSAQGLAESVCGLAGWRCRLQALVRLQLVSLAWKWQQKVAGVRKSLRRSCGLVNSWTHQDLTNG